MAEPETTWGSFLGDTKSRCPVRWANEEDVNIRAGWFVFGSDLIGSVARDHRRFSNDAHTFGVKTKPLESDPPEHAAYRRMLNPYFRGESLSAIEAGIRSDAIELMSPVLAAGGGDFVKSVAHQLPVRTFGRVCGFSETQTAELMACDARIRSVALLKGSPEDARKVVQPLLDVCMALIEERRERPKDDIVTALLTTEVQGQLLTDHEALQVLFLLVAAGHSTTSRGITSAIKLLATHQDAQSRLRADPSLIPGAVEEILRFEPPQAYMPRVATEPVELGRRSIDEGDMLYLVWPSANFDPQAFPDPDRFNIERKPNRHTSFGQGIHKCLGADLARLEMRVVVEELLTRTTRFELDGDGIVDMGELPGPTPSRLDVLVV